MWMELLNKERKCRRSCKKTTASNADAVEAWKIHQDNDDDNGAAAAETMATR